MTDLYVQALNLRERLAAHASPLAEDEADALECVRLADELIGLASKADAALKEANEIAVLVGQYPRMMTTEKYHSELVEHGRRLRQLLNEAGHPAPGSTLPRG